MLISTALALLMIPGFGSVDNSSPNIISSPKFKPSFFYSGLDEGKEICENLLFSSCVRLDVRNRHRIFVEI